MYVKKKSHCTYKTPGHFLLSRKRKQSGFNHRQATRGTFDPRSINVGKKKLFHCQHFIWTACCWQRTSSYAKSLLSFTQLLLTLTKKKACGFYLYTWNGQRIKILRTAEYSNAHYRLQSPECCELRPSRWASWLLGSRPPPSQSSSLPCNSGGFNAASARDTSGWGPLLLACVRRSNLKLFQPLQLMWQCAI